MPENTLLITGYQAVGTLGRALLDGARTVRIHKGDVPVLAEVGNLKGLSGHADAGEMMRWLSGLKGAPHGLPDPWRGRGRGGPRRAVTRGARLRKTARPRPRGVGDPRARLTDMDGTTLRALVCDIDGVILHDDGALPGAPELLDWLKTQRACPSFS